MYSWRFATSVSKRSLDVSLSPLVNHKWLGLNYSGTTVSCEIGNNLLDENRYFLELAGVPLMLPFPVART